MRLTHSIRRAMVGSLLALAVMGASAALLPPSSASAQTLSTDSTVVYIPMPTSDPFR
jgi:ABC-type sugar transport system substrate-binding protein